MYNAAENNLQRYTEKDELSNNTIYSILLDNNEDVCVTTNSGVSKFDHSTNQFFNYDVSDGLQEGQFNPGSGMYSRSRAATTLFPNTPEFALERVGYAG